MATKGADKTMTKTITVPFEAEVMTGENGFSYVPDAGAVSCYAGSEAQAVKQLRPLLINEVKDAMEQKKNYQVRMIGCVDGHVLLVQFKHCNWYYSICGESQTHASSIHSQSNLEDTVLAARKHADAVYGGVAWVNYV